MNQELITQLFQVVLIPLLGVLVTFFVKWINAKSNAISANTDNELMKKYLSMLTDTIVDCVLATNQTYVDSLKAEGKFDGEAQKVAFQKTLDSVMTILSEDAKVYLSNALGDLEKYITQKIESEIKLNKITLVSAM